MVSRSHYKAGKNPKKEFIERETGILKHDCSCGGCKRNVEKYQAWLMKKLSSLQPTMEISTPDES